GDLAGLLTTTAPLGAGFALLNPLHAALPTEPSPYNPSSRVFRNPLYLRVGDVPELAGLDPGGRARVEGLGGAGRGPRAPGRIDRAGRQHWRYCAAPYRHPGRPEVAEFGERHRDEVSYHAWLQWLLEEQLAAVPSTPGGLGVLHDLGLGVAPHRLGALAL